MVVNDVFFIVYEVLYEYQANINKKVHLKNYFKTLLQYISPQVILTLSIRNQRNMFSGFRREWLQWWLRK